MAFRQVRTALLITVCVFALAFTIGLVISQLDQWQLPIPTQAEVAESSEPLNSLLSGSPQNTMTFVLWQNGRVLLLSFFLSLFTFGVAALIIPPATFTLLGYIVGLLISNGYSLTFIASSVLTHGIIEIPVILLAASASLALGAAITRPPQGETVGHAWMVRLGGTLKLAFGVIIPGLIIAAFIEAFITPYVTLAALGG